MTQFLFVREDELPTLFSSITGDVTFNSNVSAIGAGKVHSSMLNLDVFTTANIWKSSGQVFSGNAANSVPTAQAGANIQEVGADGALMRFEMDSFGGTAIVTGVRADGTIGSPTGLVADDEILSMHAWGVDSTLARVGPAGAVRIFSGGTWSATSRPTYIDFATVAVASTTMTSRGRVENDGGLTWPASVTGGSKGSGSINAQTFFLNGVALSIPRTVLTGNTTYFVRSDGNDANTGLVNSAGGAWLTWAKATSFIATLDFNGFTVTITNGNGATYTTGIVVNKEWIGGGNLIFDLGGGAIAETTGKAFISTINLDLTGTGIAPPGIGIQNGTLSSTNFALIENSGIGVVGIGANMTFGTSGEYQLEATNPGALISLTGSSYTISGGALGHAAGLFGGAVYLTAATASFSNNVTFTQGYVVAKGNGVVTGGSGTFTLNAHTVTGPRYFATSGGVIDAGDAAGTYWPGNAVGVLTDGGVYTGFGGSSTSPAVPIGPIAQHGWYSPANGQVGLVVPNGLLFDYNITNSGKFTLQANVIFTGSYLSAFASGASGYTAGSGGTVTQATSRTTGVTLSKPTGTITLVSAAGTATFQTFTLTNTLIGVNDTVKVTQQSGTDKYIIHVTNTAAGSCQITFATTGGTTTEQPVFNFTVFKGSNA